MSIETEKIIPDLRVFEAVNVSKETGRERVRDLTSQGYITPKRTPTGRCLLSIEDVMRLANSF